MGKFLYLLFIKLYPVGAGIAAVFNGKARLWVQGRRDIFTTIKNKLAADKRSRIWVHCSSLGEFEQGRPLMEALKKAYPAYSIVLTFFSPSGYEHKKDYDGADHVFYMPIDAAKNAHHFYELVNPRLVVFIKYEFWFYYLNESKKRNIPLLLVSAIFRKSQPFFQWYGGFHKQMLQCFTHLFVQTNEAKELLQSIDIKNVSASGDTRFDRVLEVALSFKPIDPIENFCAGKTVIVAGSTWLEDDEELDHYANTHPEYRFIIAPHNLGEERLKECGQLYKNSLRYSAYIEESDNDKLQTVNTLIIDNIGMLKRLYHYATVCYVGGAFGGDGVHNVLEAAVYSKPVIFGPVYEKFAEATELVEVGGAFPVIDALELEDTLNNLLEDKTAYNNAAVIAGNYVKAKCGATGKVMEYIQEKRLLTN